MYENYELIKEIDQVLSNPLTREQIETKLVNSRSNSVNSRSTSRNASQISMHQSAQQNQSLPSLASVNSAQNQSVTSVFYSPPSQIQDSVVHQQYQTPDSLIGSPSRVLTAYNDAYYLPPQATQSRQAELEKLHQEIQMLTQRQTVGRSQNSVSTYRKEPAVELTAAGTQMQPEFFNERPLAPAQPLSMPKDVSFRSQQDTSFSTQYISELERENTRIRRNFIMKDVQRLKQLVQAEFFDKNELEYVVEKTFQQFCKQ